MMALLEIPADSGIWRKVEIKYLPGEGLFARMSISPSKVVSVVAQDPDMIVAMLQGQIEDGEVKQ